jgi:hypothetical protein
MRQLVKQFIFKVYSGGHSDQLEYDDAVRTCVHRHNVKRCSSNCQRRRTCPLPCNDGTADEVHATAWDPFA